MLCHALTVRVYLPLCNAIRIYSLHVVCCVQLEVLTEHWDELVARCNVDGGQEGRYDGKTREQGLLQRWSKSIHHTTSMSYVVLVAYVMQWQGLKGIGMTVSVAEVIWSGQPHFLPWFWWHRRPLHNIKWLEEGLGYVRLCQKHPLKLTLLKCGPFEYTNLCFPFADHLGLMDDCQYSFWAL